MSARDGSISPPPKRRKVSPSPKAALEKKAVIDLTRTTIDLTDPGPHNGMVPQHVASVEKGVTNIPSPIKLNFIHEFPAASNRDTVSLGSILGDPLIKECWLFNYLFDVDFIMQQFDPDVRSLVQIKLVHGSWRRGDTNGIGIEAAAQRYPNVHNVKAHMPEAYGTHHSKMITLFRHDDLAQVVITTGNFIEKDWRMSQAFWCSPLLPLLPSTEGDDQGLKAADMPHGSGQRFKHDILAYTNAYGSKLSDLHSQLKSYDFSTVRGALIASVPSKRRPSPTNTKQTLWGLPALSRILRTIPIDASTRAHIVTQISSVASVGEKWLTEQFFPAISSAANEDPRAAKPPKPVYHVIFPTPTEIRNSIDGYGSGASIHMKTATLAQQRQLASLKPMLCHWSPAPSVPATSTAPTSQAKRRRAGRHPAAPHIKTYTRFTDESMEKIEWAMMTSANLSTQAWGSVNQDSGECRICSYEIGVVVWPGLWDDDFGDVGRGRNGGVDVDQDPGEREGCSKAVMVPVFTSDTPSLSDLPTASQRLDNSEGQERTVVSCADTPSLSTNNIDGQGAPDQSQKRTVVGWRMPYDLPLHPYEDDEEPWCASSAYEERDWMGRKWGGYRAS